VLLSADMAGEHRTSTPQERLLKGRAGKRKAAEPPVPPSKRPAGAPQASVGAPGSASIPRPAQHVPGAARESLPPIPRESQPPSGLTSRGGVSASVVPPPGVGSGSRRGGSPSELPYAISSSQLLDLGRRCKRPGMSSVDSIHAGLGYLGKVFPLFLYSRMYIPSFGDVIRSGCVQALPYFSHGLEGFSLTFKREEEAKRKLAEACEARDAALKEAEKAKEEATTVGLRLDVINNQLLEALEKARFHLERERKVEAESAERISELSSQLKQERDELSKVRSLLSAEEKTSADLQVKLASAEEAAATATADFEYAAETIDREVSGHMRAIVEVVAERLSLQLDWNVFDPPARERYEAILEASQAVPMTPGFEAAPGTPLPDRIDNLPPNPAADPPAPSSDPSGAVPSSLPGPPAGVPLPPGPPSAAPSAPPSAQVGEGSSVKLTSTSP
jgi:hypothetical protein